MSVQRKMYSSVDNKPFSSNGFKECYFSHVYAIKRVYMSLVILNVQLVQLEMVHFYLFCNDKKERIVLVKILLS